MHCGTKPGRFNTSNHSFFSSLHSTLQSVRIPLPSFYPTLFPSPTIPAHHPPSLSPYPSPWRILCTRPLVWLQVRGNGGHGGTEESHLQNQARSPHVSPLQSMVQIRSGKYIMNDFCDLVHMEHHGVLTNINKTVQTATFVAGGWAGAVVNWARAVLIKIFV